MMNLPKTRNQWLIVAALAAGVVVAGWFSARALGAVAVKPDPVVYTCVYSLPGGYVLGVQLPVVSGETPAQADKINQAVVKARWPGAVLIYSTLGGGQS